MPEFQGRRIPGERKFAIVAARFNQMVTERLLNGARQAFHTHGLPDDRLDIAWVPGSFELPLVAQRLAASGRYAAVVCLGAVIRGETAHFEHVAREAASGIAQAAQATGVPILFGVLTTDTLQQALDRAGGNAGNKGYDAATAALEMADLLAQLD